MVIDGGRSPEMFLKPFPLMVLAVLVSIKFSTELMKSCFPVSVSVVQNLKRIYSSHNAYAITHFFPHESF